VSTRELLNKLGDEERKHERTAGELEEKHLTASAKATEDESHRKLFLLQVVQPGLAGLMDGSVSTLAPLFAAAFASHKSWEAFLVGLAASIGAGISMAFSEGLSDDGSLTGRGSPWLRGGVTGLMTTAGGIGHTLPFLISNFHVAMLVAVIIVAVELMVISYIRHRYMDTPFLQAAFQVIVGRCFGFPDGMVDRQRIAGMFSIPSSGLRAAGSKRLLSRLGRRCDECYRTFITTTPLRVKIQVESQVPGSEEGSDSAAQKFGISCRRS